MVNKYSFIHTHLVHRVVESKQVEKAALSGNKLDWTKLLSEQDTNADISRLWKFVLHSSRQKKKRVIWQLHEPSTAESFILLFR